MNKQKIIVIGGTTSSGKSQLGINLAEKFNGEIINADSRQFYIGLNIGTGKEKIEKINEDGSVMIQNIRHYLIDMLKPNEEFNLFEFQKMTFEIIDKILKQNKVPILVGGTGLYLDSIVYNYALEDQKANNKNRKTFQNMNVNQLQTTLKSKNLKVFNHLNESDRQNPHRLIRAIEKTENGTKSLKEKKPIYDYLYLCLDVDKNIISERISERTKSMLESGLLEENKKLRDSGFSTDLNSMKSIGYSEFDKYFSGDQTIEETESLINLHTRQYSKRQMTWFRRNKEIVWIKDPKDTFESVSNFLIQS